MPNRRLDYVINVDSGGAVSSLNQVGRAGADAARDIEQGFDKAGTASEQAIKALTATMDTLESDSAAAAKAVAAIGEHLTIDVDSSTVDRFVQDLKSKFGVAFDAVEADAKEFADVLERGVDMSRTTNEIKGVGDALDHTSHSADQSRSVLANLAGNSAQSLGELGGVVGDLGVGIGQLAEYAVDGNVAMSGLAKVAGPMAGLAAASLLVSQYMSGLANVKAFNTAQVESFTEAMREGSTAAAAILETVLETGRIEFSGESGIFGMSSATADLSKDLAELGLNYSQFMTLVAIQGQGGRDVMDDFLGTMIGLDDVGDSMASGSLKNVMDAIEQYANNVKAAEENQARFNEIMTVTPDMVDDAARAFRTANEFTELYAGNWGVLIDFLERGGPATEQVARAMEVLTEASGKTQDEILAIAQSKLDEKLALVAEHTEATAAAFHELHDAAADAQAGLADAVAVMGSADFDAAGIAAAGDALQAWFEATPIAGGAGVQTINDYNDAVTAFAQTMQDHPLQPGLLAGVFTATTPGQREQLDALEALGTTIMPRLTEAYDDANGSFEQFDRNVTTISASIHDDLVNALKESGVSAEDAENQANALQQQLGLIPENVATFFELQGDADATAKLALLQGSMDLLSEGAQAEVAMHILADDPQAALAAMQTDINNHYVSTDIHANTAPAMTDYWALANNIENSPITAPVWLQVMNLAALGGVLGGAGGGGSHGGGGGGGGSSTMMATTTAAAPAAASAGTTMTLAAPTPRPINVTLNAAVIGSSFDVQRAVTTAMRQAERLGRI